MSNLTEERLTLTTNFSVTSADTDMFSRLRLGGLVNFLIQSAIQSADDLGFGFRDISQQKLFWVLSRLTLKIYRPVEWYEQIEVETWPKDVERIIYLRDFVVRDKRKQVVACATSGWLAVDLETKRPKRIEGVGADFFTHLNEKHALEQSPEKIGPVKEAGEPFKIQSSYYDIDLNRHVTSTRYIDWMMDTFSIEFHEKNYPYSLSINYMKETRPKEIIHLYRTEKENQKFLFEGVNAGADTTAFRGKIDF
ncbi:MAG: acyl-[acyl-carrier-protein] thioesterase [Bacteroidales bacterium]